MVCPICKKKVDKSEETAGFHPFCSERCKLIDLGRWLSGKYQVPVELPSDSGGEPDSISIRPDRTRPPV